MAAADPKARNEVSPRSIGKLLSAMAGLCISPSRGLFVFSPFLLFSLGGIYLACRRAWQTPLVYYLGGGVGLDWLAISAFADWPGGQGFGPRYFSDIVPILMFFPVPVFQFPKKPPLLTTAFLLWAWPASSYTSEALRTGMCISGMEMRADLRLPTHGTGATRSSYEACFDGKRGVSRRCADLRRPTGRQGYPQLKRLRPAPLAPQPPVAKVENWRSVSSDSQRGQVTSVSASLIRRILSKTWPHFLHRYSYKGISRPTYQDAKAE